MKAIILNAGQGKRLLPLTQTRPKCLLHVQEERSILAFQLRTLSTCGIREAVVAVGFGAAAVEAEIADCPVAPAEVRTLFNPFFGQSDNLVTTWLARPEFDDDFLLLNGDTLFEPEVLNDLLEAPRAPVSLVTHRKPAYDPDDMKVALGSCGRLEAVSKTVPPARIAAESIGLMRFQGNGGARFAEALDTAIRSESAFEDWYLCAVDALARQMRIETVDITGRWWSEVDSPADLEQVREVLRRGETVQSVLPEPRDVPADFQSDFRPRAARPARA